MLNRGNPPDSWRDLPAASSAERCGGLPQKESVET
jgi:hypothetical protein